MEFTLMGECLFLSNNEFELELLSPLLVFVFMVFRCYNQ